MAKKDEENKLLLIPKSEKYAEYIIYLIIKLHKTKKYSIGKEYKSSLYKMLEKIMYINKMSKEDKSKVIVTLNEIDALLNTQRIYLRIMKKYKWIDEKKFNVAMNLIYEIGKILGGLIKYYAKNN